MRRSERERKPIERFNFGNLENDNTDSTSEVDEDEINIPKKRRISTKKSAESTNSDDDLSDKENNVKSNKKPNKKITSTAIPSKAASSNYIFGKHFIIKNNNIFHL